MPKQKTHKGAKKRLKITAKGKLLREPAGGGHLQEKKDSSRKRRYLKKTTIGSAKQVKTLKRMLGSSI